MTNSLPYIINLGNSIIGVSVLAMPFCFSQVGIILGTILLLCSAAATEISCKLLMRAALASKRRSYEFLALHTFGAAGKLAVEVCIIGMLIGSMIAFHVIIGDLGPSIISKTIHVQNTPVLRAVLLLVLAACVVLPLGLLRDIESLNNVSALSISFYSVFVAQIFGSAFPHIWSGTWIEKVHFWRPEGIFRCLPIFALAFGCQTQLFVMYEALPEPSIKQMNSIVRSAVGMCTSVYLAVGFFGYIAYSDDKTIQGDILMHFKPTLISDAIKLGFCLSVALSFPLCIFPCRGSIYTLLFPQQHSTHQHENIGGGIIRIPESKFKAITISIIVFTLIIGIMVPNVEFILGLTGSTMGSMIGFIFPGVLFISVMSNSKVNKSTAQIILILGVVLLIASTYTTLQSHDKSHPIEVKQDFKGESDVNVVKVPAAVNQDAVVLPTKAVVDKIASDQGKPGVVVDNKEKRLEPVEPHAPDDNKDKGNDKPEIVNKEEIKPTEKKVLEAVKDLGNKEDVTKPVIVEKRDAVIPIQSKVVEDKQNEILQKLEKQQQEQKQLIEEHKQLIQELKQHNQDHDKAVETPQKPVISPVVNKVSTEDLEHKKQINAPQVPVHDSKDKEIQKDETVVTKSVITGDIKNNLKANDLLVANMQAQEKIIDEAKKILKNEATVKAPEPKIVNNLPQKIDAKIHGINMVDGADKLNLAVQDKSKLSTKDNAVKDVVKDTLR